MQKSVNIILFTDFTVLDVFGPVEVFSKMRGEYSINFYSEKGGIIKGSGNTEIVTAPMNEWLNSDVLIIPGGAGSRDEVNNYDFIEKIKSAAISAEFVLTVCTGSALLAKTGLIDNKQATSNKLAFDWVKEQGEKVNWIRQARWVTDGKYYTSSGVSAGMDMALAFLADRHGIAIAENIAHRIEYNWQKDKDHDPYA